MPHVFFLSYARNDNDKYSKLRSVIDEIENRVAQLRGNPPPPVAFIDVTSIDTGERWEELISRAAHEAQVLVCMMSASYVSSEWCAKEFDVFRRRISAAGAPAHIIPVLWDIRTDQIPLALRAHQYTNDRFPPEYVTEGLRTLRSLKKRRDQYRLAVEQIAQAIHAAAQQPLPPLQPPLEFAALPRAFDNPGRYNLAVCSLHTAGPQWRIDPSGAKTLGRVVDEVARNMKVPWRDVVVDHTLPARIATAVAAERAAVVVVVPADIAANPVLLGHLRSLEASNPPKLGVLIASDDEAAAKHLVPAFVAGPHLVETFSPARLDTFTAKLGIVAERLRSEQVAADTPLSRIADASVEQAADAAGVPISSRPSLAGPGGTP